MAIDIRDLVAPPSFGALAYQADALIRELDTITKEEYPAEAVSIKYVLLAIADYLRDELCALHQKPNPVELDYKQARALGRVVHSIYSFISHLKESSPLQCPPAIQETLSSLTKLYVPAVLNNKPICLIQPKWEYNFEYIPLRWKLAENLEPSELDPTFSLEATTPEELLSALWRRYWDKRSTHGPLLSDYEKKTIDKTHIPIQVAVLSFARLDTNDTLLFPLLAHELGHFIDYSESSPRHVQEMLLGRLRSVRMEDVENVLRPEIGVDPRPEIVYGHLKRLNGLVEICLRELLADQLAIRILGFSFFIALAEFLKTIASWGEATLLSRGYPGITFRLRAVCDEMVGSGASSCVRPFLEAHSKEHCEAIELLDYLDQWDKQLPSIPNADHLSATDASDRKSINRILHELAEQAVVEGIDDLRSLARELIPNCPKLSPQFFRRIEMLHNDLPPFCQGDSGEAFTEILAAAWAYQCIYGEIKEMQPGAFHAQLNEYHKTCRLVLKAIEILSSQLPPFDVGAVDGELDTSVGVLSQNAIKQRIVQRRPGDDRYLGIIPYVEGSLQGASLEVHLGNRFTIARRTKMRSVDLGDKEQQELLRIIAREKVFVFVPRGEIFLVHPGDFVLGATLEFVSLPRDLVAFVEGKSSVGRTGLVIATATQVAPGFHGVIVLELANTGTVPLEIKPGMAIAQLVFLTMSELLPDDCMYHGKHYCQIEP